VHRHHFDVRSDVVLGAEADHRRSVSDPANARVDNLRGAASGRLESKFGHKSHLSGSISTWERGRAMWSRPPSDPRPNWYPNGENSLRSTPTSRHAPLACMPPQFVEP
jgi:hypothetical protein